MRLVLLCLFLWVGGNGWCAGFRALCHFFLFFLFLVLFRAFARTHDDGDWGCDTQAMNMGVRLGIDAKVLSGIVNTSTGRCWSSDTYNPVPGVMEVRNSVVLSWCVALRVDVCECVCGNVVQACHTPDW